MSKAKNNLIQLNYWDVITKYAIYNHITIKESVKKFYKETGMINNKYVQKILLDNNPLPYGVDVKIHDFIIDKYNDSVHKIIEIQFSNDEFSYILEGCGGFLFGAENLILLK